MFSMQAYCLASAPVMQAACLPHGMPYLMPDIMQTFYSATVPRSQPSLATHAASQDIDKFCLRRRLTRFSRRSTALCSPSWACGCALLSACDAHLLRAAQPDIA